MYEDIQKYDPTKSNTNPNYNLQTPTYENERLGNYQNPN